MLLKTWKINYKTIIVPISIVKVFFTFDKKFWKILIINSYRCEISKLDGIKLEISNTLNSDNFVRPN